MPRVFALVFATQFVLTACGDANELSGSIEESFSLEFDRVEIRFVVPTEELEIQYLKDVGNSVSKVVKVVVDTTDLPLGNDSRISGDLFDEKVVIQREAESGSDFPDVNGGSITFDKVGFDNNDLVEGEFDAVFVNGRTLFGKFKKKLDLIDPDA